MLTLALLLTATLPHADAPKAADAQKAAAASLEALATADWKAYAKHVHPDSLKAFRDGIIPALEAAEKAGKVDKELLAIFGDAEDVKTVTAWKPEEFFVTVMSSLTRVEVTKAMFTMRKSAVVGTVQEGKDQAHVVVRTTYKIDKNEMKTVGVVSLKLDGGKWKVLADDLVAGLGMGVKATLELNAK